VSHTDPPAVMQGTEASKQNLTDRVVLHIEASSTDHTLLGKELNTISDK